jgi:hypothetical protein
LLAGGAAPKSASILLMLLGPGAVKKRPKVQIWRQIVLAYRRGGEGGLGGTT